MKEHVGISKLKSTQTRLGQYHTEINHFHITLHNYSLFTFTMTSKIGSQ